MLYLVCNAIAVVATGTHGHSNIQLRTCDRWLGQVHVEPGMLCFVDILQVGDVECVLHRKAYKVVISVRVGTKRRKQDIFQSFGTEERIVRYLAVVQWQVRL